MSGKVFSRNLANVGTKQTKPQVHQAEYSHSVVWAWGVCSDIWVISQMLSGVTQPSGAIRKPESWPVCVSSQLYPESFWTPLLRGALFEGEEIHFLLAFFQLHTLLEHSFVLFLNSSFLCVSFRVIFITPIMTPYLTSLSQMMNECHNALILWHPRCSIEPTRQSKHLD